ncbi:MAG: hypothetical protein ABEJ93_04900 [Candidatus Nanohalobium sp.]
MERNNYSRGLETIEDLFVHELRSILFLEQRLEEELEPIAEEVSERELSEELLITEIRPRIMRRGCSRFSRR